MKRLVLILVVLLFIITGCGGHDKHVIIFNDEPFTKDNFNQIKTNFYAGEKIYYLFASKDKFKSPYIRVQISSVVDKGPMLMYKPFWSGDFKLMNDEVYYYSDYIVVHTKGKYLVQIFLRNDLHHPLAFAYFVVN